MRMVHFTFWFSFFHSGASPEAWLPSGDSIPPAAAKWWSLTLEDNLSSSSSVLKLTTTVSWGCFPSNVLSSGSLLCNRIRGLEAGFTLLSLLVTDSKLRTSSKLARLRSWAVMSVPLTLWNGWLRGEKIHSSTDGGGLDVRLSSSWTMTRQKSSRGRSLASMPKFNKNIH
ncbi:hypothetical protein K450DRAFT_230830 [Umbelopsis ramanniana AG]|uniref:Secreted protein n=1 Tax=Umbelopsis ramanniana AG TaxID=1314678 RepID=A0AAD5HG38_UMBRA|nr:uncharacterized protein K450DRAFT_230830 [Umbelopsis ramanniana AG]KAI8581714.1 hypothetical protein K450DRAFT_230830 [Umbelopsis ramanniana AG]